MSFLVVALALCAISGWGTAIARERRIRARLAKIEAMAADNWSLELPPTPALSAKLLALPENFTDAPLAQLRGMDRQRIGGILASVHRAAEDAARRGKHAAANGRRATAEQWEQRAYDLDRLHGAIESACFGGRQ